MSDRDQKLVEAALAVFTRYGVSKTTMNDIARAAGVARQTLYNAYQSKEDVLRASVRHAVTQTFDVITKAWVTDATFGEKLDTFFEHGPLSWYDIGQASPDARELYEGIHTTAQEELNRASLKWLEQFETLILVHAKPGSVAHENAADLAEFIYSASANAKYDAADRKTLETRLRMLKKSVLALFDLKS